MAFMLDKNLFQKFLPLLNNFDAWQAFKELMEHEQNKQVHKLIGKPSQEDLIRIQAVYDFLHRLKGDDYRQNLLDLQKELINGNR